VALAQTHPTIKLVLGVLSPGVKQLGTEADLGKRNHFYSDRFRALMPAHIPSNI